MEIPRHRSPRRVKLIVSTHSSGSTRWSASQFCPTIPAGAISPEFRRHARQRPARNTASAATIVGTRRRITVTRNTSLLDRTAGITTRHAPGGNFISRGMAFHLAAALVTLRVITAIPLIHPLAPFRVGGRALRSAATALVHRLSYRVIKREIKREYLRDEYARDECVSDNTAASSRASNRPPFCQDDAAASRSRGAPRDEAPSESNF